MTQPLVSIVIPLFNHASYIIEGLNSVVNDPYPNKEIVIIDDGSSDNSVEVVERWVADGRADSLSGFHFMRQENCGVTKTANKLIFLAKGQFIAVMGSDDYLVPGGIQARVDYLLAHPAKLAVIGDSIVVDKCGKQTHGSGLCDLYGGHKKYLLSEKLVSYELLIHWCVPGPVFMARKELYELVGGYDETISVEDWDFYLRLMARELIAFIDVSVAAYRVHPKNYVFDTARAIGFNQAMLKGITNNIDQFSGLRRIYLWSYALLYRGKIARLSGKQQLLGLAQCRLGGIIRSITKRVYKTIAPFMA
jgi:glycosyltransferase involved in cell wall biosynthesis